MAYRVSKVSDVVPVRLPKSMVAAIRRKAQTEGKKVNDVIKEFVAKGLGEEGVRDGLQN